jgi:putative ABC transport system permease protein
MIKDYFKLAWENITHRRIRSWLTIIGIVIGIAAVVALVSLGQGVKKVVTDEFDKLGVDKVIIQPTVTFGTGSTSQGLTSNDVRIVKNTNGVIEAAGLLYKTGSIEFNNEVTYNIVLGMPLDETKKLVDESANLEIIKGRDLKNGDKNQALIGFDYYRGRIFDKSVNVGDKLTIEGKSVQVVGVIKQIGNPIDDGAVYIPADTLNTLFNTTINGISEESQIIAKVDKSQDPAVVADTIKRALRRYKDEKEGEETFSVQTTTELLDSFGVILNSLTAIVIGIAAISLFVGGVGIMNTMYTAVLQRTNEIGVMKAIGAKNSHIMNIFLIESGMLGLIGGSIGIAIGIGLSKIIEFIGVYFLGTPLLRAYFPWYLIVGALAFAFVVGTLSGLLPARQASKQSPVESLRYE